MTSIWLAGSVGADLALDGTGRSSAPLACIDLDVVDWSGAEGSNLARTLANRQAVGAMPLLIGIATGQLPRAAAPVLSQLSTTLGGGLSPWCAGTPDDLSDIAHTVERAPYAALALDEVLRATESATVADALVVESLAYSMLLAGPEFLAWRHETPRRPVPPAAQPVLASREGQRLTVTLNRPERHNAFGHAVRDGLLEALEVAIADESVERVVVRGFGRSFCSGGDLDEFGTTPHVAAAHLIRLSHSAGRTVAALGDRIEFEVHGSCIGAGIEVPAFAPRVLARADAVFRLPELRMGLIPGAGGTVSIPRRIGRWRTAWLALTDRAINVERALVWKLVDGIV